MLRLTKPSHIPSTSVAFPSPPCSTYQERRQFKLKAQQDPSSEPRACRNDNTIGNKKCLQCRRMRMAGR
ncbi:hypothetical protein BC830DRAFT_1130581 [Chytriomyces sp. MP71]|nr:hypothetical protein BC830DRAFT_1130581 [Chytriomyces sp. MP71]